MKSPLFIIMAMLILSACNSIRYEPKSMTPGVQVYAVRGGYSMKRSIKEALDKRGYEVIVGHATNLDDVSNSELELEGAEIPFGAKYAVRVSEREEKLRPWWCLFNGFWWWNFNVSIADQDTGYELMTWRGRGCAHSSMRKLEHILDEMANPDAQPEPPTRPKPNIRMRNTGIMYI